MSSRPSRLTRALGAFAVALVAVGVVAVLYAGIHGVMWAHAYIGRLAEGTVWRHAAPYWFVVLVLVPALTFWVYVATGEPRGEEGMEADSEGDGP